MLCMLPVNPPVTTETRVQWRLYVCMDVCMYGCMPIVTELQNGTMSSWYTCTEVLDGVLPGVQALSMEGEDAEMAKALAKSKDEYDEKNQLREESFGGNQLM